MGAMLNEEGHLNIDEQISSFPPDEVSEAFQNLLLKVENSAQTDLATETDSNIAF